MRMKITRKYILSRIKVDRRTGCWIWQKSTYGGYGQLGNMFQGSRKASRAAYILWNGPLKKGWVLHKCDNPPCCNPKHLQDGTPADNSQQMAARGRVYHPPGRPYNTKKARKRLAQLYANPKWRRAQGRRIAAGFRKEK